MGRLVSAPIAPTCAAFRTTLLSLVVGFDGDRRCGRPAVWTERTGVAGERGGIEFGPLCDDCVRRRVTAHGKNVPVTYERFA